MSKLKQTRTQSPMGQLKKEARAAFKKAVTDAELRGYTRGIKAAHSIVRGK